MTDPSTTDAPCLTDEFAPITEIAVPIRANRRYDRALAAAATLAERWNVPVHIVHVRVQNDPVDNDRLEVIRSAFHNQHPAIHAKSTLVSGEVIARALESVVPPTALIVMSSDHADRDGSSSTAEDILRHLGGLALIVGPHADSEHVIAPVTVALDGSPTAERALAAATAFAGSIGSRIELVQVVGQATSDHVARLRAQGQTVSESGYLHSVAERMTAEGHSVGWALVHDEDPVHGLLDANKNIGGGLIVIGTHGDTGLTRRMLGSTAMGLVADNNFPVLVVTTGGRDEAELSAPRATA